MSALSVNPPFPIFLDIDGQPLDAGYIYLGVANQATEANPISAYWDAALTVPATQPILTRAGFPVNAGVPARVYVNSDFSIVVKNRNGFQVFSSPTCTDRFNDAVVQVDSSDVTFLQAGTGAVTRTAQAKMRDTVSVKDFGADPAASASVNTAAIQAAADYCESTGAQLFGDAGIYTVNGTITLNCSGDLSEMTISANGTTITPVIRVGKVTGSSGPKIDLKLPKLSNSGHVAGDGWATYASNVGVSIDNLFDSVLMVPSVTGFGIGVYAGGVDFGLSYCQITTTYIVDNKVNLKIGPKSVSGWSNANTYYIGRCRHNSSEANPATPGVPWPGTRNILLDGCNDNLLLKPTIEGSSAVTEFALEMINANFNSIVQPRWEDSASGGGSTMKVRLEAVAPKVTSGNVIIGGYEFSALLYTIVGNCDNNTKIGTGRGDQSFSLSNPIGFSNVTGNGLTTPQIQGFPPTVNPLGKTASATDWVYRIYGTGLDGKRSTDTESRLKLNFSTAGITFGPGGTTAPTSKLEQWGTPIAAISCTGDFNPVSTNTYDLGAASYRWQDCFLVNAPNVSSDANTKQQIRELSIAEKAVAVKCKGLIRAYKLNSAVALKGTAARTHFGAIAQDVKAAFESEGLDPFEYGLLCYDQWDASPEQQDEEGNVTHPAQPAGELYSVRYEELLAFIISSL